MRTIAVFAVVLVVGCGSPGPADDYADRMAREHEGDRPKPTAGASTEPARPVVARTVTYGKSGDDELTGYLARPEQRTGPLPGLIVIHEWWGLNDNIRAVTRRLAGEGYAALAVDLYGGDVAEDPEDAHRLMQAALQSPAAPERNLQQAHEFLVERLKAPRVGTIGWCFGGGWSLNTALMLPDDIDATVIYYGRLETDPEKLEPLSAPILGIFGEQDQGIPVETVRTFEEVLRGLGKEVEIRIYEGADHAFANPSGTRYAPQAAEDAWAITGAFLKKHLGVTS
jgi:carboxymethylenebutenolidase